MHTIVIGRNQRTAVSVMRYYALLEMPRHEAPAHYRPAAEGVNSITLENGDLYEATPACFASRKIQGLDWENLRIIIASDYLKWHFLRPGGLTQLWRVIQARRVLGATVVWA